MDKTEHVCARCSNVIPPNGPVIFRDGQMLHLHCLSGETPLRSMELVEHAREALAEAERLLAETDCVLQEGQQVMNPKRHEELPPAESV